jgi:hypothetical protein
MTPGPAAAKWVAERWSTRRRQWVTLAVCRSERAGWDAVLRAEEERSRRGGHEEPPDYRVRREPAAESAGS